MPRQAIRLSLLGLSNAGGKQGANDLDVDAQSEPTGLGREHRSSACSIRSGAFKNVHFRYDLLREPEKSHGSHTGYGGVKKKAVTHDE